ncbi:hypothetical protein IV79_GL000144 [Pediococcus claussenii]|nr:hypothetical protein IV79_GL000144 [Pediococcus claussenii]
MIIGIVSNLGTDGKFLVSTSILALAVILLITGIKLKPVLENISKPNLKKIIIVGLIIIFVVQILVLKFLPATVFHDPFRVLSQAETLSIGNHSWSNSTYFWRYPNNVSIAFLLSKWIELTNLFNISTNLSVNMLSIIFLDTFILLTIRFVERISKSSFGPIVLLSFFVVSPFAYTYYLQVFYSDLPSMLALLITFVILYGWKNYSTQLKVVQGILLTIIIAVGQLLKPTLIFVLIAILLVVILRGISKNLRESIKKIAVPLVLITLGIGIAFPASKLIEQQINFHQNSKYQLPMEHWVWMSYSPQGNGEYVGNDVETMMKMNSIEQRKTYLKTALPKRIERLGVAKVIQRWVTKAGIFLNVSGIQIAYTGGYINASHGYQVIAPILSLVGKVIMQSGFILLYLIVIVKSLRIIKMKEKLNIKAEIALILALGYLAFHTLVWESENRYGQVIIPMLILIASLRLPPLMEVAQVKSVKNKWLNIGLISSVVVFAGTIGTFLATKSGESTTLIVAAQRSQLSSQYGAKKTIISAHSSVNQKVNLNYNSSRFSVLTPYKAKFKLYLVNLDTNKKIKLKNGSEFAYYEGALQRGHYQIIVENPSSKDQSMSITVMQDYKLAPYGIKIGNTEYKHSSLVYTATRIN